jgi:hypothetical protein
MTANGLLQQLVGQEPCAPASLSASHDGGSTGLPLYATPAFLSRGSDGRCTGHLPYESDSRRLILTAVPAITHLLGQLIPAVNPRIMAVA